MGRRSANLGCFAQVGDRHCCPLPLPSPPSPLGLGLPVFAWHITVPRVGFCLPIAMIFCMLLALVLLLPMSWLRRPRTLAPPAFVILYWLSLIHI